jgi:AraC family transcriptional regulator
MTVSLRREGRYVETNVIEATITKQFRLERAPTLTALKGAGPAIAFTRLQGTGTRRAPTLSVPPEDAFAFEVTLAPLAAGEMWVDGRSSGRNTAGPGDTYLFDLSRGTIADLAPPFDFLRFCLPVTTLDRLAYDRGLRRVGGLRTTSRGIPDPVMHGLAISLLAGLQDPPAATSLLVDYIALAFHAHIVTAYGGVLGGGSRAGLAPWQLRRTYEFIEAHLDGDPSIGELAKECGLSESHFARAFRQATGVPPHRWLMTRRIERAKELLLEGDLELTQIALACGFADQSHLNRHFVRAEGYSPGKWRRLRRG